MSDAVLPLLRVGLGKPATRRPHAYRARDGQFGREQQFSAREYHCAGLGWAAESRAGQSGMARGGQ